MPGILEGFPYERSGAVEPFDLYRSQTVNFGTTANLLPESALRRVRIPEFYRVAWVTLFGHAIDNVSLWSVSVWRITINGVVVRDYNDIRDQLAEFVDPQPVGPIRVEPGQVIGVEVDNNSGATNGIYGARLRGFLER